MAKISPVSAKYIIHSQIQIEGVVDRPDIIGAIFGQTEGLLGSDLELRELQRSGRIGRIEVKTDVRSGKTSGVITIPSSLDKAETAIIGAAMETIQRIGPCNSKVKVEKIEDVRISKRRFVIERAKELLKELTGSVLPDSQEITDEVAYSVRMMEIGEYGKDRLPAGPAIDDSDEIIIVEGRADVLNLLKHGFKNIIALNGTSIPETIVELCRRKTVTLFVDGDRGGDLIVKEAFGATEIDFVTKAPGMDAWIGMVTGLGLPLPVFTAYFVGFVELLAGIALIIGLCTRFASSLLAIVMIVAIWKVKFAGGFFGGYEFDLTLLAANISLMFSGSGSFSVDEKCCKPKI